MKNKYSENFSSFFFFNLKSDSKPLDTTVLPKNPCDGKTILAADVENAEQTTEHISSGFSEST